MSKHKKITTLNLQRKFIEIFEALIPGFSHIQ
jgi:hypothetical protein